MDEWLTKKNVSPRAARSANRAKGSRAKRPGAGSLEACKLSSRISARTFSAMGCVKISAMAS